jgi:hypothetical protein
MTCCWLPLLLNLINYFKAIEKTVTLSNCFVCLNKYTFPKLTVLTQRVFVLLDLVYICEHTFSKIKLNNWAEMTDEHPGVVGPLKIVAMGEMSNFGILVNIHLCCHFFS